MANRHLNHPQCQLEAARGMLLKTATLYADIDAPKAYVLRRMAQDLVALRDPGVAAILRQRRAQHTGPEACRGGVHG